MRRFPGKSRLTVEVLEDRVVPSYAIIDLGATFAPQSINSAGLVAGAANSHAALWQNDTIVDLGTLGGPTSQANDLNDAGQVVGFARTPSGDTHAFLVTPEDTNNDGLADRWFRDNDANGINDLMLDLGSPTLGTYSLANGINNSGQVVGRSGLDAVLWSSAGIIQNLGTFGGRYAEAKAINNHGQVVGTTFYNYSGTNWLSGLQGFFWDPNTGGSLLAQAPYPNNKASQATGLNDAGQVVGSAGIIAFGGLPNSGHYSAELWQNAISAPTNLASIPYGYPLMTINNNSQVVGFGSSLWQGGMSINLNSLLDASLGWTISGATAINDAGQIVGQATHNGVASSFLLSFGTTLPPSVSISDVSVSEGNSGAVNAVFTVTRSGALDQITTVNYSTADGAAGAGSDYAASSGTLTFAAGETSKTITVLVSGDRLGEPNETFFVNLSSPTNATIADGQAIGTIVDDEPRISISDVSKSEGKKGQTTLFTFTVTLSNAYDQAVTMSFATVNGTAKTSDGDYIAKTGTLTFAPGQTSKTITIEVKGDSKKEDNETFYLDLFGLSGNSLFTKNRGLGTILNDD